MGGKRIPLGSLRGVFREAGRLFRFPLETDVQLSLVTDRRMRGLNRRTRGEDRSTDVLSFPLHDTAEIRSVARLRRSLASRRVRVRVRSVRPVGRRARADWPRDPDGVFRLGDVVIAVNTAWRQAREAGVPLDRELARLFTHGLLHLLGFDHQKSSQARAMERIAQDIVGRVGKKTPPRKTRGVFRGV